MALYTPSLSPAPSTTRAPSPASFLSNEDFKYLCQLIKDKSGLALTPDKMYLIDSRLTPVAKEVGAASLAELTMQLRAGKPNVITKVINAMATHETFFFRDQKPFDQFKNHALPMLLERNKASRSLRIWCAAASSGQEPYSLGMILQDFASQMAGWRIEILASDLSQDIIDRGKKGLYTQFEVQRGLPIQYLMKYFKQTAAGGDWQLSDTIKNMVRWQVHNLFNDFKGFGMFDVVFCRNVLIYFDPPSKSKILDHIADVTNPHGFLSLGGAETIMGLTQKYEAIPELRGLYAKK